MWSRSSFYRERGTDNRTNLACERRNEVEPRTPNPSIYLESIGPRSRLDRFPFELWSVSRHNWFKGFQGSDVFIQRTAGISHVQWYHLRRCPHFQKLCNFEGCLHCVSSSFRRVCRYLLIDNDHASWGLCVSSLLRRPLPCDIIYLPRWNSKQAKMLVHSANDSGHSVGY